MCPLMRQAPQRPTLTEPYFSIRMRIHQNGRHISGGEDLVASGDVNESLTRLASRLLPFSGEYPAPQQIFTIDPVSASTIRQGTLLPARSLESSGLDETRHALPLILESMLERPVASHVLKVFERDILGCPSRNGALLLDERGHLLNESDSEGIRTTHLGCLPSLRKRLESTAVRSLIKPSHRFADAIILASKVLMADPILLEVCASDDPAYQTGYIASRATGYVRIPFIKPAGLPTGGRLYLVKEGTVLKDLITFLRETPVLFSSLQQPAPLPFPIFFLHDIDCTSAGA